MSYDIAAEGKAEQWWLCWKKVNSPYVLSLSALRAGEYITTEISYIRANAIGDTTPDRMEQARAELFRYTNNV